MFRKVQVKVCCLCLIMVFIAGVFSGCAKPEVSVSSSSGNQSQSQTSEVKKPADYSGTITMWGYSGAFEKAYVEFNKVFPNIKIQNVVIGGNALETVQKYQTTIASGLELPDIGFLERYARGRLLDFDIWEDLEQAPYNFDKSTVYDFTIPLVTNPKGKIVCMDWDLCSSGLFYRKELAKQYFGTDDPKELQALLPTWEAFIQKGKEVKQKSSSKVFMFPGVVDAMYCVSEQNPTPMIVDNKANITETWAKTLDYVVRMRNEGIVDNVTEWSPAWNASFISNKYIFYPGPTWGSSAYLQDNDPTGANKWGLMVPPEGCFKWGGTALGITKTSKNKELAWQFINWFFQTNEGAKVTHDLIGYNLPLKRLYDDPTYTTIKNPLFGDENLGDVFITASKDLKARPITSYDAVIDDIANMVMTTLTADDKHKMTTADAVKAFETELVNKLPDVSVK